MSEILSVPVFVNGDRRCQVAFPFHRVVCPQRWLTPLRPGTGSTPRRCGRCAETRPSEAAASPGGLLNQGLLGRAGTNNDPAARTTLIAPNRCAVLDTGTLVYSIEAQAVCEAVACGFRPGAGRPPVVFCEG